MGSQPKARAHWPPRRPSEIISVRLPTSFERITWRLKPGNVCWLLGSHQAVDQSFLALFGQVLPLLSIFLTAFQKWGAVLRHAGQCLKRGQRLQCNRKKKPDGIFPPSPKPNVHPLAVGKPLDARWIHRSKVGRITSYNWVQMASMKDTCMLGILSFFSRFIRSLTEKTQIYVDKVSAMDF